MIVSSSYAARSIILIDNIYQTCVARMVVVVHQEGINVQSTELQSPCHTCQFFVGGYLPRGYIAIAMVMGWIANMCKHTAIG